MTRRLSGIHAAWHFWYAVSFGGESGLRKVSLCGIPPLIGRYATRQNFQVSLNLISLATRFLVSANQHSRLKFLNHSNRKTCQSS
ncbi:TPA: DUF3265 domain-containing protein [Vibrio parahaemolyticus]|nr:DUF3265 domain-containing protein [Vibrio parahaemolyticus]